MSMTKFNKAFSQGVDVSSLFWQHSFPENKPTEFSGIHICVDIYKLALFNNLY